METGSPRQGEGNNHGSTRRSRGLLRAITIILRAFFFSATVFYVQVHSDVFRSSIVLPQEVFPEVVAEATHRTTSQANTSKEITTSDTSLTHAKLVSSVPENNATSIQPIVETNSPQEALQSTYPNSTSPFAYAFVIGGCDPDDKRSYQNYLFNIAIAALILQERGSKADVVAMFQIRQNAQKTVLPYQDLRILHALGVYVYMIPQQLSGKESFYRTQLDKFRILGLTQYKRVLFMDGDVIPLSNLDYLMELSLNGALQENLVIQGIYEPANGGFFMLTPGHLSQVQEIIEWRERTAKKLDHPFFDEVIGWGHAFTGGDQWVSMKSSGTNWTFLAAFADQGLLYHYTKYVRKNVSIVLRDGNVENWGINQTNNDSLQLMESLIKPFKGTDNGTHLQIPGRNNKYGRPIKSHIHFTGRGKPWMSGVPKDYASTEKATSNAKRYWYYKLHQLNEELNIGLNFSTHWSNGKQRPSLGLYPVYKQVLEASSNLLTPLRRVYPENSTDFRIIRRNGITDQ